MQGGEVAQIGAPMEVYLDPASTFVASFLGNPPMNLVPARAADGRVMLDGRSLATAASATGDVTFGIRPEDVAFAGPHDAWLSGRVASLEPLGAETLVHVENSAFERPFVVRAGRTVPVRAGETVHLKCAPEMVRLFDPGTGRALPAKETT